MSMRAEAYFLNQEIVLTPFDLVRGQLTQECGVTTEISPLCPKDNFGVTSEKTRLTGVTSQVPQNIAIPENNITVTIMP